MNKPEVTRRCGVCRTFGHRFEELHLPLIRTDAATRPPKPAPLESSPSATTPYSGSNSDAILIFHHDNKVFGVATQREFQYPIDVTPIALV